MQAIPTIIAIVPAAGQGTRMSCKIAKQYLKIDNKTILEHTLDKLLAHPYITKIIVVISPEDKLFQTLPIASNGKITSVIGGDTRAKSVLAGLKLLQSDEMALVHDAARPCVHLDDISRLIDNVLSKKQGAILAMPLSDTIKRAKQHEPIISKTEDRNYLWAAATPQLFQAHELKIALQQSLLDKVNITDEASAIEYMGGHPLLVECRRDNIKITKPEDLALARFYLTLNKQDDGEY